MQIKVFEQIGCYEPEMHSGLRHIHYYLASVEKDKIQIVKEYWNHGEIFTSTFTLNVEEGSKFTIPNVDEFKIKKIDPANNLIEVFHWKD
ncbi:hypothetical protein [Aneurinibacillus thermoaerophilus]|jgi:hypothetical protein|uniref:hypothetical protein n=1 Tax=Aneurinibacillus thermoaerophilus TaxID=143495 RepID=UPI002E1AA4B9|nr:hypothetical protein [Aneurinibacillus thermoaerophilus]